MPRRNYGNAVKQRTLRFFTLLLDFANDELEGDESGLENLQRSIQINWQSDRQLIVRTKVRYLVNLTKYAAQPLTSTQIKEAIDCWIDFLKLGADNRTSKQGSEVWHFTINLWYSRRDRGANIDRFNSEWEQRKEGKSTEPIVTDFWYELVKNSLQAQAYDRLTTNSLMATTGLTFNVDRVYVPLGLVERKPLTLRAEEEGDAIAFGAPQGAIAINDVDEFLRRFVANFRPTRIAIIGEPGSGKTTFLQRLAIGLLERETEIKILPIWISLADLQHKNLENYILEDWLKIATKQIAIASEMQADLVAQFNTGRVWLLLDAVDEMVEESSIALAKIARQLRGWIGSAHIVLTCRSNVWDSGKNALETFNTYCNLSLSNGYNRPTNQIKIFIDKWFQERADVGGKLWTELAQPQYQRLRDAIENPLRLALLCRYRSLASGDLPTTKANLYHQFTDTIYEWKQDCFPTSLSQRLELNAALAKLALRGMQRSDLRFRLNHQFVLANISPTLLELALQIGWLNRVGIASHSGEQIYAFYHPTFQEYFAAQAIDNWEFFLSSSLGDNSERYGEQTAPIFTNHWRETILFWCGRSDISNATKSAFIDALINFPDRGAGCYRYRAYFLAAATLAEFPEYPHSLTIIEQLLKWRFAELDPRSQTWQFYPSPIQEGARLALRQTERQRAIISLENFVQTIDNPFTRWQSAHSLGKVFDPGNAISIQALTELIDRVYNSDLLIKVCESLGKIAALAAPEDGSLGSVKAIDTLLNIIHTDERESYRRKAAFTLAKIVDRHPIAIATLEEISTSSQNFSTKIAAQQNLAQLLTEYPSPEIQSSLVATPKRRKKRVTIPPLDFRIAGLEQRLTIATKRENQRGMAYQLGKLQPGNIHAIEMLLQLLTSPQPDNFYKRTAEYLKEVITAENFPLIITTLNPFGMAVEAGDRSSQALECYKILWYCAEQLPYQSFAAIWNRE
jgi:hypothetical protein